MLQALRERPQARGAEALNRGDIRRTLPGGEDNRPAQDSDDRGESGMTTGGALAVMPRGVTRALLALLAAEAFYRVAIRSQVRRALGI